MHVHIADLFTSDFNGYIDDSVRSFTAQHKLNAKRDFLNFSSAFQLQTDVLLPTKNKVHNVFGKGGLLNRYDKYRYMSTYRVKYRLI